jgi:hypothetical protein
VTRSAPRILRRLARALIGGAAFLVAAPSLANGRFPAAGQIVVDPEDGAHLVLRATFGLLVSRDRGASAGWVCESAIGYGGQEDPMMGLAGSGALLAGLYEGLSISRDGGCTWSLAGGALEGLAVIDLSVRPTNTEEVLLLAAAVEGPGSGQPRVLRSSDHGETWSALPGALPEGFLALTLDAASSLPSTIYVSGRFGKPDYQGALLRSTDDGESWERHDIPSAIDRLPYLSAIAPNDPSTVYVRIDDLPGDALVVSHDGGAAWSPLFEGEGDLLAFALSPDGSELVVGGDVDGLHHASSAAADFTKVSSIRARCATWAKDGLHLCADQVLDGFAVGLSTDGGQTVTAEMALTAACAPLACAAGARWSCAARPSGTRWRSG